MNENLSEDDFIEDPLRIPSDSEAAPNFAFHCLKDDPDLLYEFKADDCNGIDINDYLDEALSSNLKKLDFEWKSECLLCANNFEEYQDLLKHCMVLHENEFEEYSCTLHDCVATMRNEALLARHLVLRHADLESIKIYSECPHCGFRCANFNQLNKHSCYRKLTRKACIQPYCQYCKQEFASHKRLVFHLQFHLAKRRPKICLICNANFNGVEEFFEHVNYAHEPPGTMACTICDRIFLDMEAYNRHQDMHKSKLKYKCNECSKTYYNKRYLDQHKENVHANAEYECDVCSKILPTYTMLQTHMKSHNPEAEVQVYTCANCGLIELDKESLEIHQSDQTTECFECEIEDGILTFAYSCLFCSLNFKDKDSLRKHRTSGIHKDGKFYCPLCNREFENYKTKGQHLGTHNNYKNWLDSLPLKRYFMCDVGDCDECYNRLPALHRHITRIHKATTCHKCNQKFANTEELQSHAKECGSHGFICQFCHKNCPTKMSLAIHVSRRHNNKNTPCPHCSCVLKDKQALQKHVDDTHVTAICPQCDKVMSSKRYLELHIKEVHKGECRYLCSYCNKGFFHRSKRDTHEEAMHPESLYKCGKCNYQTKYAKSLEIHVDKHLKQEQFLCPYCSRKFGRSSTLKMHIKRHENDKPFRCWDTIVDGCDAAFVERNLLNRHIKSKHANKWNGIQENITTNERSRKSDPKRKLTSTNRRKTKTVTSKATAMKCDENQNAPDGDMLPAAGDAILVETNKGVIDTPNEKLIYPDDARNNDKDYMLFLMDDITMKMVNDAQGELFVFEDGNDTILVTASNEA